MTIERHDDHPPGVICRPAGNGLCEQFIPLKVPDLSGPLGQLDAISLEQAVQRVLPGLGPAKVRGTFFNSSV